MERPIQFSEAERDSLLNSVRHLALAIRAELESCADPCRVPTEEASRNGSKVHRLSLREVVVNEMRTFENDAKGVEVPAIPILIVCDEVPAPAKRALPEGLIENTSMSRRNISDAVPSLGIGVHTAVGVFDKHMETRVPLDANSWGVIEIGERNVLKASGGSIAVRDEDPANRLWVHMDNGDRTRHHAHCESWCGIAGASGAAGRRQMRMPRRVRGRRLTGQSRGQNQRPASARMRTTVRPAIGRAALDFVSSGYANAANQRRQS